MMRLISKKQESNFCCLGQYVEVQIDVLAIMYKYMLMYACIYCA